VGCGRQCRRSRHLPPDVFSISVSFRCSPFRFAFLVFRSLTNTTEFQGAPPVKISEETALRTLHVSLLNASFAACVSLVTAQKTQTGEPDDASPNARFRGTSVANRRQPAGEKTFSPEFHRSPCGSGSHP